MGTFTNNSDNCVNANGVVRPPRRLLDQLSESIRLKHYSIRTEQAYRGWVRRSYLDERGSRRDRRQDESSIGKGGGHAVASGQRVCRPGGSGPGTARDGREVEREDRHPRTVGDLGTGRLHRHHRCHGHAAQHCASHSRSGGRLCPGGQGQSAHLAASIEDFVSAFEAAPGKTPHQFHEVVEKDHGRLEVRRCHVFGQLDCLHAPERWPDLKSFAMVTSERTIKGQTSVDRRFYVSSLLPDAQRMNEAVRRHWRVESVPQAHRKEVRNGLTNCVEATRKMRVGPSGSAFRSGPQTTPSCCGQEPWW
jgi:predicted transposase YbfD/YdcC